MAGEKTLLNSIKKQRVMLLIPAIAFLTAILPLFTVNCIGGHDIEYHLLRIEALKEGILAGLPFLRVNLLFFGGEGYASSLFYPDTFLYFPALLRAFGIGINASFHIFIALCVLLCLISSFLAAWYCTESMSGAVIIPVIITLCQYHIDDIYTRAAVGEVTAFIFVPLVIAGLYDLLAKDLKRPWILGLGMAGVVLSHTLTTVFCIILSAFVFVIYLVIGERGRRKQGTFRLFLTAAAVLALTAFYWLPVLEQMGSNVFRYKTASFDVWFERLLFKDVFLNRSPGMGLAPFLLLLPGLFSPAEKTGECSVRRRFALVCFAAGILFTLCSTGAFPWKRFSDSLMFVQFPWRVFIVASPLLAFAAGIFSEGFCERLSGAVSDTEERKKREQIAAFTGEALAILVLAVMVVSAIGNYARNEEEYYSYSNDYFDYPRYTESVIGGEWLPESADDRHALTDDASLAYTDAGERLPVSRYKNTCSLTLSGKEAYVDVPFVWYLGYRAVDETGKLLSSDGSGENGRMRVYPEGAVSVLVTYEGTKIQHYADMLSLIVLLGMIVASVVILIRYYSKRKERKTS